MLQSGSQKEETVDVVGRCCKKRETIKSLATAAANLTSNVVKSCQIEEGHDDGTGSWLLLTQLICELQFLYLLSTDQEIKELVGKSVDIRVPL